jgi:hypothetical protein
MGWAEEKAKLKAKVHETFALPALYTRAETGASFPVTARLNNDVRAVGGNSEQGFMQIIQDIPKLRIAIAEMQGFLPCLEDRIDIPSENKTFVVRNRNPDDGVFHVVEVEEIA